MNAGFWADEVHRLGELLDRAEAMHDSFAFDEIFVKYREAEENYRLAVLEQNPFTGWGL